MPGAPAYCTDGCCVWCSRCCLLGAYASHISIVRALGIVHRREMTTIFFIVVAHAREALAVLVDHDVYGRAVGKRYTPGSGTMLPTSTRWRIASCRREPEETDGRRRQLKGRRRRCTQPGGRGGIGFDRPGSPIPIPLGGEGTCFHVYNFHLCKFSHLLTLAHTCSHLLTLAQSYTT